MSLRVVSNPAPLRREALDRLREAIADGVFKPGERLLERTLLEQMGISRPSLRETLRQLESEGLIVASASRGVAVAQPSAGEIEEIYEVRIALEGLAARLFAARATDDQMQRLAQTLLEIEAARLPPVDRRRFRLAKTAFYEVLFEGAANATAATALRSYHNRLALIWGMGGSEAERQARVTEMRAIMAALQSRDGDLAVRAYEAHLRNSLREVLRIGAALRVDTAKPHVE